jgi:hypothetical protein
MGQEPATPPLTLRWPLTRCRCVAMKVPAVQLGRRPDGLRPAAAGPLMGEPADIGSGKPQVPNSRRRTLCSFRPLCCGASNT